MLKKILLASSVIIFILIIWSWPILKYGIQQGKGQLEVILNAKPIEYFLSNSDFPDSLKAKLHIAQKARNFAISELGLNESKNYTKLYDQKGKVLLWNLSACAPFSFTPYQWDFPFLGSMPYKGFFEIEEAKKEQNILDSLQYDTRIRPVGGWSTLGILNDPILSNMLNRSDGALAEVIIHELTHSTIFIKNNIEFNENLASFIGEQGAVLFLEKNENSIPNALDEYISSEQDSKKFREHMLRGAMELDRLYKSFDDELNDTLKKEQKIVLIEKIVDDLDTVSFSNENYKSIFKEVKPNNAYFMSLKRYHSQSDTLSALFRSYDSNINFMISGLKATYGK